MPTQMTAQVDKLLTGVSLRINPTNYVSEALLPRITVPQHSGLIGVYGTRNLEVTGELQGGMTQFPRITENETTLVQYLLRTVGRESVVTLEDKRNYDRPFDALQDRTLELTDRVWLEKEKHLVDQITNPAVITQNTTLGGTDQYSDYANSDPLVDFSTARSAVYNSVGTPPDTVVMSWEVFNILSTHPALVRSLGFADNRPGGLNEQEMARAMKVDRVLIAGAVYKPVGAVGTQSVWGKDILFCVSPRAASTRQMSIGYHFTLSGTSSRQVFRYNLNNPPESEAISVRDIFQMNITYPTAGYLIIDAIA